MATTTALLKLADSKAQLGQALAEARSTYNMMASRATSFLTAYRAARRGNYKLMIRSLALGDVYKNKRPSPYLEYIFGWKPLMDDLRGLYHVARTQISRDLLIYGVGRTEDSTSGTSTRTTDRYGSYLTNWSLRRKYHVRINARIDATRIRAANQVGLVNVPAIAWDLIPYSFLFDWFFPIGNVLEALTATVGLTPYGWSRTFVGQAEETSGSFINSASSFIAPDRVQWFNHIREAGTGWPSPMPYSRCAPFKTGHVLTAVELFRLSLRS